MCLASPVCVIADPPTSSDIIGLYLLFVGNIIVSSSKSSIQSGKVAYRQVVIGSHGWKRVYGNRGAALIAFLAIPSHATAVRYYVKTSSALKRAQQEEVVRYWVVTTVQFGFLEFVASNIVSLIYCNTQQLTILHRKLYLQTIYID